MRSRWRWKGNAETGRCSRSSWGICIGQICYVHFKKASDGARGFSLGRRVEADAVHASVNASGAGRDLAIALYTC